MLQFIKETGTRLASQTPAYFKKIRNASIGIGAAGTALLAASTQPHVHFPPILLNHLDHMITIGVVGTVISQLTKDTPPSTNQPSKN